MPLQSNRNHGRLAAVVPLTHPYAVPKDPARPRRVSRSSSGARFAAVAAEPPGPGFGRARDPLAREVRLLGALLGQVIAEQAGPELFELVERIRRRTISLRRGDPAVVSAPDAERARLAHEIASLDLDKAAAVAKAFTLYFQLVNLAEERQRIRVLRTRSRAARGGPIDDSIADAIARLLPIHGPDGVRALVATVHVHPVLTAHPTEARRRTLLVALRRIRRLLDELDDPLTTPDEDADLRRRVREEISILWHTAGLRAVMPTPLDEVRSALAIFDETLFTVVPGFERAIDRALDAAGDGRGRRRGAGRGSAGTAPTAAYAADAGRTGTHPVLAPALLRFGSWIGADRDGHPGVTSDVTHARRAPPGRPPAPRLRGRRAAADADDRRARGAGRRGPRARPRARPGRRGAARDDAPAPAAAFPRSPTGSGWARSRSGSAAPGRR